MWSSYGDNERPEAVLAREGERQLRGVQSMSPREAEKHLHGVQPLPPR